MLAGSKRIHAPCLGLGNFKDIVRTLLLVLIDSPFFLLRVVKGPAQVETDIVITATKSAEKVGRLWDAFRGVHLARTQPRSLRAGVGFFAGTRLLVR